MIDNPYSDFRLPWIFFVFFMYLLFFFFSDEKNNDQCMELIRTDSNLYLAGCGDNVPNKPKKINANLAPFFFEKTPINTASREALEALNGIGPSLAKNIIDYRNQHGSIKSIEELHNIRGIGEKRSRYLSKHVSFRE